MGTELIGSELVELRKSSTYSKNRLVTDEIVIRLRNEFTCTANPYQTFGIGERNVIAQFDKVVPTGSELVDVQISPHSSAPNELKSNDISFRLREKLGCDTYFVKTIDNVDHHLC